MGEHQRALAQIVERQRRQHDGKPRNLDRTAAEMPEIGIKSLGSGDGEKHGAKRKQSNDAVVQQEIDAVERIERPQHARIGGDPVEAGQCDRHEPDQHDRAEQRRDLRRTARLHREQGEQDHHRQRHDIFVERRRHDVDAFDRGEHRQCRRDDGIAVEQRGADDAEQRDDAAGPADTANGARCKRHQGKGAALAVIIRAQQDHYIFERDDDEQRPQDERHHAEHRRPFDYAVFGTRSGNDGFAKGVERAGADIAVNNADAANGKAPQAGARTSGADAVHRHFAPCRGSAYAICHEF